MPQHLFHVLYSVTNNLHHSILHHLSTFHPPSPLFPSSILHLSLTTCSIFPSSDSLPLCSILFLSSRHPFTTPCLPVPTLTTYHSVCYNFLFLITFFSLYTFTFPLLDFLMLRISIYSYKTQHLIVSF